MHAVIHGKSYIFLICRLADNRRTRYREAQFFSYMLGMYNWKHSTCNETTIILYSADDGVVSLYNKILRWIDIPEFCLRVSSHSPLEEFALMRANSVSDPFGDNMKITELLHLICSGCATGNTLHVYSKGLVRCFFFFIKSYQKWVYLHVLLTFLFRKGQNFWVWYCLPFKKTQSQFVY